VDENVEGARAFVKKFFAGITAQKNKIIHPSKFPKVRDEWKEAARELFGKREKQTVDEALASVRTPSMHKPKKSEDGDEEAEEYTGTSALVAVKEEESAWQKVSARFREAPIIQGILDAAKQAAKTEAGKKVQQTTKQVKDKLNDAQEEVLEVWETSQNPWVYRLSSIYDGLFGETPVGVAIKEIRRAEPDFILEEWKENIEDIVLPGVLEAFLRGNSRDLKKWFGEAAYSRVNIAIRERKSEGLVMDPHVLSIDNVEVMEATVRNTCSLAVLRCHSTC
jgi:import inner membrane translocase subunit TIM44